DRTSRGAGSRDQRRADCGAPADEPRRLSALSVLAGIYEERWLGPSIFQACGRIAAARSTLKMSAGMNGRNPVWIAAGIECVTLIDSHETPPAKITSSPR